MIWVLKFENKSDFDKRNFVTLRRKKEKAKLCSELAEAN